MRIVVLVKHVPDPTGVWSFAPDQTLDRGAVAGRLSELDEYAIEQAVRLVEGGIDAEITYLSVGPQSAKDGLLKALAIGGDRGVHVLDDAIHGSDSLATSLVLAKALEHLGFDLVLAGMSSTDAAMSVVPSMVAERLGVSQATFAGSLSVDGTTVSITRESDTATEHVRVGLPAVVSITDQTEEARYPAFRAIMMAKKKPVEALSLADIGVDPATVGLAAAATRVLDVAPAPARASGTVVVDDGTGAAQLADFLVSRGAL
jgi:electron transfer flavoprotein beta subunit